MPGLLTFMPRPEKLLSELIALPSVNPAFLPAGHPHAGEQRVADYLGALLARAGLEVEWQTVLDGRSNLLARLEPKQPVRRRIWLVPHLDTVNAADDQFRPAKRNGRFFGRGACDTKGSVAAMASAVMQLACSASRPRETEILFAGVIDEENAQSGSRFLANSGRKADLAIIGEPTRLQVVTAHKGSLWLRYETRGKSAHGARPELGRNAVHQMARAVDLLETEYAAALKKRRHPLLGSPTVNVGLITGGTQPNIVPDRCTIEIDRRTLPGETEATVKKEISVLLGRRNISASPSTAKVAPCWPMETDPKHPMVSGLLRCFAQTKPAGVDYFCDAGILSQGGITSVVFGPGDIAQAHTSNEWIASTQLSGATAMLLNFLRSLP